MTLAIHTNEVSWVKKNVSGLNTPDRNVVQTLNALDPLWTLI